MNRSSITSEFSHQRKKVDIYACSVLVGVLSGLIIVCYRTAISFFELKRISFLSLARGSWLSLAAWLVGATAIGLLVAFLIKRAPYIKGSGIPQVKASLMRRIHPVWKKELPYKFVGGSLALGVGFSLGREGPSIQLGALTGGAISDAIGRSEYKRYLVTAGAAAGISAAFNAPLAGVLFCVEELHKNISPTMLTSSLIASFCANAVMWAFYGNSPVFGITLNAVLPLNLYFTTILIGILSGVVGSLFNRGLLAFQVAYKRAFANETLRVSSAFLIVALVSIVAPVLTGGGDRLIEAVETGRFALWPIIALLAGKMVFTLFSYSSGTPGGIFLPMLAIGALLGSLSNSLLVPMGVPSGYLENFILIGMVGFFTAVVRAPITGAVLITEMAGSFAHFPAFILVSVIASIVSGLLKTKPIYDSLLVQIAPEPLKSDSSRPVILHIPVLEGSILETCTHVQEHLPAGCILVSVEHGEDDIFPHADLDIQPGDILRIVVESGKAHELKEHLIGLGQASSGCLEFE
jgi:H+/Cl- antiporter ClcA